MLRPVTETVLDDEVIEKPTYPAVYKTPHFVNLAEHVPFTQGHPWHLYRALRETAPIAWYPIPDAQGFWAVSRYEDIRRIELDPTTFSSQMGGINMTYGGPKHRKLRQGRLFGAALNTLICLDRPSHIELRMQHRDFFSPDYVSSLRDRVEQHVDRLLDRMEQAGPVANFVKYISEQLPLFTLCEMLGIDEKDRPRIIQWMHYLELAQHMSNERAKGLINPLFIWRFSKNMKNMFRFGQEILLDRRRNPRDDLLSVIANAEVEGEKLSQEFLDGSWLLIIFAGNDTTRNSLSGTMKLLSEFPAQKQKLVKDPSRIKDMVPEAIRMVTPVIHMRRTVTTETEIAGQKVARGEKVIMYYGAANRDPSVFPNPDNFDIDRNNSKDHLAFGTGPHVCLGQRIANMQLEAAFTRILDRFPDIEWTGEIGISPNNFVHAINRLDVNLGR